MNRTRTYAATAAAALAASTGLTLAFVPAGNAATTMTFVEHSMFSDQSGFVDVNHNGRPDDGDQFLIGGTLVNSAGKASGYDRGFCEFINVSSTAQGPSGDGECLVTAAIPGGQLTVQGILKFTSNVNELAVTGGTGNYAGRSGSARVTNNPDGTTTITITLQ